MKKNNVKNLSFKSENIEVVSNLNNKLFFENQIVPMWISTRIAASILGISPNALRIRKHRGEIQCKYFGKELRFNTKYLLTLLQDQRKDTRSRKCQ